MMNKRKVTILLTNDDGYLSNGIQQLKEYLETHDDSNYSYEIYLVAPDRERSAISMSLSINHPLRLHKIADKTYAVEGTPTDCINIALQKVLPQYPDFVVSGMNQGENLAEDVFFSGTVAGGFAGQVYGIPSLAVSMIPHKETRAYNYHDAVRITAQAMKKIIPLKNNRVVFNLNIPYQNSGKIVPATVGLKYYKPSIIERTDPRGRQYYWIGSGHPSSNGEEGSDLQVITQGHCSLSVLKYDLNDSDEFNKLTGVFNED